MSRYLSELGGWFSSTVRRKAGQSLAIACESSSQVDETRLVGRAWGELLLYYTLGSDPALWPAGERREGGLITHDKGYYHSYLEGVKSEAPECDRDGIRGGPRWG